eukprot:g2414.t1
MRIILLLLLLLVVVAYFSDTTVRATPNVCDHGHRGPTPTPPNVARLPDRRPKPEDRTFRSPVVEAFLEDFARNRTWRDPNLATLFRNALPNTIDTTCWAAGERDTFISTGDIPAMWLRDSQNQVLPYLRFAAKEPDGIGALVRGLIRRHVASVLLDPYANSFQFSPEDIACDAGAWLVDNTTKRDPVTGERVNAMRVGVHQRKWEMDSLLSILRLGRLYYASTQDASPLVDGEWVAAVGVILRTLREMQMPLTADNFTLVNYTFQTETREPKDTFAHGIGRAHRWTGMVRTAFLPSDDSARFPYHVPDNALAVVELRGAAKILREIDVRRHATPLSSEKDRMYPFEATTTKLASDLEALAKEIDEGIQNFGVVRHASGSVVYACEVDGFGNYFFGDDANVPSLLSLPYLGYVPASDSTYVSTRRLLLDGATNPFYFGQTLEQWTAAAATATRTGLLGGIGSEDASGNAGLGHVWPLSLIVRLMTIDDRDAACAETEARAILSTLVASSGGTGLLHESFWYSDPSVYTRAWFAMANSLFGEAIVRVAESNPSWIFV